MQPCSSEVSEKPAFVLVKFKIFGNLKFLSHLETVTVFHRAISRAGIKAAYSKGFNPRQKLSLSLPRSVGLSSDEELLHLQLQDGGIDCDELAKELADQLPDGCEIISVDILTTNASPQPDHVTYQIIPYSRYIDDELSNSVKKILASEKLNLMRRIDDTGRTRAVDVRKFIESIEIEKDRINVECRITSSGSIRVDEILSLLNLDADKLSASVRRLKVKWH